MVKYDTFDIKLMPKSEQIKILLRANGLTLNDIAKQTGLEKSFVSMAVRGYSPKSDRFEKLKSWIKSNLNIAI